ncbi:hypothetical protein [Actinomadura sp. 9N407]|uniref:hypothetical protein n=1 Tax=Actinomadura sp. 9N407 TaxID=3375154 RepID=UPI00378B5226
MNAVAPRTAASVDIDRVVAELRRRFPGVRTWWGQATKQWWALTRDRFGADRLIDADSPAELGRRLERLGVRTAAPALAPPMTSAAAAPVRPTQISAPEVRATGAVQSIRAQEVRMTIATERTAQVVRDPRTLIPTWAFSLLAQDFRKKHHVSHAYAERVVGQLLVFLKAAGQIRREARRDPAGYVRLVPSRPVDEAWHAALQRTEVYLPVSLAFAGSVIHHRPVMDDDIASGAALARTIPYLHRTGLRVDPEFWNEESGSSCCPPECASQGGVFLGSWEGRIPGGPLTIAF